MELASSRVRARYIVVNISVTTRAAGSIVGSRECKIEIMNGRNRRGGVVAVPLRGRPSRGRDEDREAGERQ